MAYSLLSQINPSSRQWIILVRVSRRWHYRRASDTGPIEHTDLVLLDEQSNHMYAEINLDNVSRFKPLLKEGRVYELRKFIVAPQKNAFKPVRAPYMIWFTRQTMVQQQHDVPDNFPIWTYNPIPFTEIPQPTNAPEYFVDVIGVISAIFDIEQIQTASHPTPSLKRTVFLRDTSDHEIRLDMWGKCATRFDKESITAMGETEPIIAIFVGTLPKMFKGQISLSASSPCRWYINTDVPEINVLRASRYNQFKPLRTVEPSPYAISTSIAPPPIHEKTVKELLDLDPFDCEGKHYACTVTITRLSPGQRWWFPSCLLCHKSATPHGMQYRCSDPTCTSTHADPKYRISLIGSDGTDEAEFVLFGKIGQQIVRKPILNLLRRDRPIHEPQHEMLAAAHTKNEIPNDIAAIVSQKYTFIVSITDKSFLRPHPSFQVHRIDTAFGRQLHSSLFYASSSSSHQTTAKDISLIQQTPTFAETELTPSSAAPKDTQIAELTTHPSQRPLTIEPDKTPSSAAKQAAISSASTSGDAIPISHHVRRSLFTDETSPEQIPDPKLSLKEQTHDRSKSTEEKALSNKAEQLLPVKRSAAIPGQSTTDAPATKKTAVTKADKE